MTHTTYATFTDLEMAKKAAGALLDHGILAEHISIIFPEHYDLLSHSRVDDVAIEHEAETGITTTTAADSASGAAKGAGLGVAAGALAALASVFVPGIGLVVGGGALALAIGAAVGTVAAGAVVGGVTGYLKDQGVPEDEIHFYDTALVAGGAVISVFPTDETLTPSTIEAILLKYEGHLGATLVGSGAVA